MGSRQEAPINYLRETGERRFHAATDEWRKKTAGARPQITMASPREPAVKTS